MIVTGAIGLGSGGTALAADSPGVGSASAEGFQVTPHEGSLAVGAVFDEALAGHTDKIARAQSQGLDLGAVGAAIKGYNCGQPPTQLAQFVPDPLQAETPSSGGTAENSAGPTVSDNNSDGSVEHVVANDTPYGEATTTFGGTIAAPGNLLAISHVVSKAWSGLVNGVREAAATVDIGQITIAGVVSLSGLHWEAIYPTGSGGGQPSGDFQIGKVSINGVALPRVDPTTVAQAVNTVLGQIGLQLSLPASSTAQGIVFESPLQIEVVPNSTRNGITDPIIAGVVEPNYFPIANGLENGFANTSAPYNALAPLETNDPTGQLESTLCQTDTPITVADITVASFTAGGFFNIALGGANASSGDLPVNPYNLGLGGFGDLSIPGTSQFLAGTAGTPAVAGDTGSALSGVTANPAVAGTPSSSGSTTRPGSNTVLPAATVTSEASGPLLGVGLGILGLLVLLAEADRRMIRRGVKTAVFEE
ncbi:MAG TPA: hypothetical protein VFV02_08130 [Acidimicrobiales bacterium]|nr:hypothetical protein [Acidimicrobiales bacterium]